MLLAASDVYGLTGLRMALGATPQPVRNSLVLGGMHLALIGVALGGVAAALVPVLLIFVTLLATYPVEALRWQ